MLERMGIHVERERISQVKLKNVAAVMVTANMPPFSRVGNKIDVLLSSAGDAKSLLGGTLLITPLKGVDQQVYALASGPVVTGGFAVSGAAGGGVQKNHPTVGLISKGATVEKEIPVNLDMKKEMSLCLFNPDFTTAERVKEAINHALNGPYAKCEDSGTIAIKVPEYFHGNVAEWVATVERL
jgi:flagellar P-ring protein precursor FlgI